MSSASGSRRVQSFGDYFSLDDILTTNERVPCKVELIIPKLGLLNTSSKEEDLKPGTKLDLPYWLAAPLLSRHIVSAEVPKVYRETYREILSADAVAVDLCRLQPQYYKFGLLIQKLPLPDVEYINNSLIEIPFYAHPDDVQEWFYDTLEWPDIMQPNIAVVSAKTCDSREAFKNRFRHIMDCSQGSLKEDQLDLTARLDMSEQALFTLGRETLEDFQRWQRRQSHRIATGTMVANHRKRKRATLTDSV